MLEQTDFFLIGFYFEKPGRSASNSLRNLKHCPRGLVLRDDKAKNLSLPHADYYHILTPFRIIRCFGYFNMDYIQTEDFGFVPLEAMEKQKPVT